MLRIAPSPPRTARPWQHLRRALMASSVLVAGLSGLAHAETLPSGGNVAAGSATIAATGGSMAIDQSTARAVINWNSFSVGPAGSVAFNQPDAQSATLNRVTGTAASSIAGQITSNGAVYLVNPNGIAITASGSVNTAGGFVASALDIADEDFMAGKAGFTGRGASGRVSNAGSITASQGGYVALLGGSVANNGYISVPLGKVGLGSGEQIALDINGRNFMQVGVPTSALAGDEALVGNSGTITATGGTVLLKAATLKDAVRNVINMSGSISADSAVGSGGTILLLGGAGGTVTASGSLTARASGASGDGGFIETSGAHVDLNGLAVDTGAAHGQTGTWLIDPVDFTVAASGGDITGAALSSNLAGSNVTILSSNGSSGTDGDIVLDDAVTWSSGTVLTLSAFRDIAVNANLSATGANAGLVMKADNTGTGTGTVAFGTGAAASLSGAGSTALIYYNPASFGTATDFSGNVTAGTVTAYQLVRTLDQLQAINDHSMANSFALGRDIDASATASWNAGAGFVPLGTDGAGSVFNPESDWALAGFTGSFDGQGHTVANLTINRPSARFAGLFGFAGRAARISDLGVVNSSVTGSTYLGGLLGANFGTISRSHFTGSVTGTEYFTGGLVGINNPGATITESYASGSVSSSYSITGGLVGYDQGTISKSYSSSNVTGTDRVGGLVGYAYRSSIMQSHASGIVSGSSKVGGLVGGNERSSISQSHASGLVSASWAFAGGLVGWNDRSPITQSYATGNVSAYFQSAGGLVGQSEYASITQSYATGKVSSRYHVGGLLGHVSGGLVSQAYATGQVSGEQMVGGLAGTIYNSASVSQSYATGNVSSSDFRLGGLVGLSYQNSSIAQSYSTGTVSGNLEAGGLVGHNEGTISSSYWDVTTSGKAAMCGVAAGSGCSDANGLATAHLQDFSSHASTYAGWDFATVWSPPSQVGQAGQTAGYYPQLYALTPVAVVMPDDASRNYGDANPDLTGSITGGGPGYYVFGPAGDSLSLAGLFETAATNTTGSGDYSITAGNALTSSGGVAYRVIVPANAVLTITPRPLTVVYTANPVSRSYGDRNPLLAGSYTVQGLVGGDAVSGFISWSTGASTLSNVGSYAITGSGLWAGRNYALTSVQAPGNATALTITPRAIIINAYARVRTYGDANPALTWWIGGQGLANGNTLSGALATSATTASNVGTYAITQGTLAASANYSVTYNGANLTILPRPLTVTYTASAASRTYGDANPALTGSVISAGLVNGDSLGGAPVWSTPATATSAVGAYRVTGSGLSASSNYRLTTVQAAGNATALTIIPRAITITADALTRYYGSPNPAFSYTIGGQGLVNGDKLVGSLATSATIPSAPGDYAIVRGSLWASPNYAVTYTGANLTIIPR